MTQATTEPGAPPTSAARSRRGLLVVVLLVVLGGAGVLTWLLRGDAEAPYSDASASGALTLCNAQGNVVTKGSTKDAPFVSRAVASTAAKGLAAEQGRTATLFAFQPREGAEPGEWSGQQLTAASSYTNAAHPMAQATDEDIPLQSFLVAFPTRWDGFIQLRVYLASPSAPQGGTYDTADIKVDGDSWERVGPSGTGTCTDGDAVSSETRSPSGSTS